MTDNAFICILTRVTANSFLFFCTRHIGRVSLFVMPFYHVCKSEGCQCSYSLIPAVAPHFITLANSVCFMDILSNALESPLSPLKSLAHIKYCVNDFIPPFSQVHLAFWSRNAPISFFPVPVTLALASCFLPCCYWHPPDSLNCYACYIIVRIFTLVTQLDSVALLSLPLSNCYDTSSRYRLYATS